MPTIERRLTGWQFLAVHLSPTLLNAEITDETFQQSEKQDSFRHILKSSASMFESSGSQFFRTTTAIQLGPDAFDESRFVMTFLTILGVAEILCSFRLVLEGKTGHEIPKLSRLEFLVKFLANTFALSDTEDHLLLNRRVIADLPLVTVTRGDNYRHFFFFSVCMCTHVCVWKRPGTMIPII